MTHRAVDRLVALGPTGRFVAPPAVRSVSGPARTIAAVSPFTLRRTAARVVLLDSSGQVLLLSARDPADAAKQPWWEIPGGGIDPNEATADAARRELHEETGITEVEIGPCVWTQHSVFSFGGYDFDQHEHIHVAWCDPIDVDQLRPAGPRGARGAGVRAAPAGGASTTCSPARSGCSPTACASSCPTWSTAASPEIPHDITHHGGLGLMPVRRG